MWLGEGEDVGGALTRCPSNWSCKKVKMGPEFRFDDSSLQESLKKKKKSLHANPFNSLALPYLLLNSAILSTPLLVHLWVTKMST